MYNRYRSYRVLIALDNICTIDICRSYRVMIALNDRSSC